MTRTPANFDTPAPSLRGDLGWSPVPPRALTEATTRFDEALHRVADRRGSCLWIAGRTGFGKTTLLRHLASRAEATGALLLSGTVPPTETEDLNWSGIFADARPSIPLASVVSALDLASADRLRDLFPWLPAPEDGGKRAKLDAPERQKALTSALARLLERLAQRLPVLLFLDEFDRAGSMVTTQLQTLLHYLGNSSVLFVLASQPGESSAAAFRQSLAERNRLIEYELEPMRLSDIDAMVAPRVAEDACAAIARWLHQTTGGHPTFVREAMQSLIQSGVLQWADGGARLELRGDLARATVPANLEEVLRGRVAGLEPELRRALRAVAALGEEAPVESVARLTEQEIAPTRRRLERLEADGFLERGSSAERPDAPRVLFQVRPHWLVDLVLSLDDAPSEEELRRRAAELWQNDAGLDPTSRLSRRSWTLHRIASADPREKLIAHQEAGEATAAAHRYGAARRHLEAALDLFARDPQLAEGFESRELRLCETAGQVFFVTGPFPVAARALDRALVLLNANPKLATKAQYSELWVNRARLATRQGNYKEAREGFARAVEVLGKSVPARDRAVLQFLAANATYRSGDTAAALELLKPALAGLESTDKLHFCRARTLEAILAWAQARHEDALAICGDTLERLAAVGPHPLEVDLHTVRAMALSQLSRFVEQRQALDHALMKAREWGVLWSEAVIQGIWGVLEQALGNDAAAIRHHQADLAIRLTLMDRRGSLFPRDGLAGCYAAAGDLEEALDLIREVIADGQSLGVDNLMPEHYLTHAGVLYRLGRAEEALVEAQRAHSEAERFQKTTTAANARDVLALILSHLGRHEEAKVSIEAALASNLGGPSARAGFLLSHATVLARSMKEKGAEKSTAKKAAACKAAIDEAFQIFESLGARKRIERAREELIAVGALTPEPARASTLLVKDSTDGEAKTWVQCFGPMRVLCPDGREIGPGDWGSNKARAIFAYLLLNRVQSGGVPKEKVLEAIWPDAPWDSVEKTFHSTLAILRRVFPRAGAEPWAAVVQGGGCYTLELADAVELDCEEFDREYREAMQWESRGNSFFALKHYKRAAELHRGDFLEDSYLSWTDRYREHYRQAVGASLWRLGVLNLGAWRPEEALASAQRLLTLDSLDERAHRLAMHAYVALGQRRAAIEQYKRCAETMKAELQAAPDPETLDLARRIKAGQPLPPL